MHSVLVRRFGVQQITHEVVPTPTRHVVTGISVSVTLVGEQQQIEVFVGLDEFIDHEQRIVGRNVVVHRAVGEQQVSFKVLR